MLCVLAQAAITEYHTQGDLKNKHLFLTVLEAQKSKIKMPSDPPSGEELFSGLQMVVFSLYPHMADSRVREQALGSLPRRVLIPFMRADPHALVTSQRPRLLISSHWGVGFQHMKLGGGDHIWSIALCFHYHSIWNIS